MERNRVIAVVLASMAAMLVIIAGKSCTESISKANGGGKSSKTPVTPQYQAVYSTEAKKSNSGSAVQYEYEEEPAEETEYIPATEIFTDENGEVYIAFVSEPEPEPTTVQKSVLEEYQEVKEQNKKNKLSGYNHGDDKNTAQNPYENATIPSDFQIMLN